MTYSPEAKSPTKVLLLIPFFTLERAISLTSVKVLLFRISCTFFLFTFSIFNSMRYFVHFILIYFWIQDVFSFCSTLRENLQWVIFIKQTTAAVYDSLCNFISETSLMLGARYFEMKKKNMVETKRTKRSNFHTIWGINLYPIMISIICI